MTAFLKQVAEFYYNQKELESTCFVLPNRRSTVFFRKYLGECVRKDGTPLAVPRLYTINDFFCQVHGTEITDRVRLLMVLYHCYKALYPQAEPLDEFIFWGDMLLADFGDVDKYLADPRVLFQNVADLKSIQDNYSYLSDTQREAIGHFLAHFQGRKPGPVKERFLSLWNILYPLYRSFNEELDRRGMAYEGKVYRALAERLKSEIPARDLLEPVFPDTEKYVFVGLNALNLCEQLLLGKMRDAGLAAFVWDYSSEEIRDPQNKSSLFLSQNVRDFPPEFVPDPEGLGKPDIRVVSVPSAVGQAKLAPWILEEIAGEAGNDMETAFVLPDETLLLPLLNAIPPEHDSINVTMGYPMRDSAVYTLVDAIGQMQLHLRKREEGWYFYHRSVHALLSASLFRQLLTPEETAIVAAVKQAGKYYIPLKDLQGGPLLDLVFRPVYTQPKEASAAQNHATEQYLSAIIGYVGRHLGPEGEKMLELDFAKRCHTVLNMLADIDLPLLPASHLRVLDGLLQGQSVPFRGEPLQGLQIMGPLETRALDFRNLVILSANEGTFPRKSFQSSFIPPELRKGFGLPTHEYQDAVWAYYFYRMIQRAQNVWLVYDSRTEGLKSGEESRYIKQLEYHFHLPVKHFTASAEMCPLPPVPDIPKTEEHIRLIREKELSATALQAYLACPAKFYYREVEGLESEEEVAESLDAGMLGNVFHKVMQDLYRPWLGKLLPLNEIIRMRDGKDQLRRLIRTRVMEEMKTVEVTGRNLVLEEVLLDYVTGTLDHDRRLLADAGAEGFRILGLESRRKADFHGFHFKGFVDRIDSYIPGEIRILDYKTGKVKDEEIAITDSNAQQVADKLFAPPGGDRPKIALQLFLYDYLLHQDPALEGNTFVNSIYSTARLYTQPLEDQPESPVFSQLATERLSQTLDQLVDPEVPFQRTEDLRTCQWCDFKMICGR
jgi:hypothetical protein